MQTGIYIHDRILPQAVKAACQAQGISFAAFSDNWILRLQKGSEQRWVYGYKFDINPIAASLIAQDKVATYLALQAAGIPALQHDFVRSLSEEPIDATHLQQVYTDKPVVLKPLMGTGGRGVQLFQHVNDAIAAVQASSEQAWAASPLVHIQSETRYLVLDGTLQLVYIKQASNNAEGLQQHNMSQGATIEELDAANVPASFAEMAIAACKALGLRLAAVDIVTLTDGTQMVLEVNDGCSMEHYARLSPEHQARAYSIYSRVVAAMFS